ncbi:MAG: hypothetical protein COB65_01575 [Thalassobium sp.]|nr:MAG: hypothetical protein COB65_01575 [Thalassobium sp.]
MISEFPLIDREVTAAVLDALHGQPLDAVRARLSQLEGGTLGQQSNARGQATQPPRADPHPQANESPAMRRARERQAALNLPHAAAPPSVSSISDQQCGMCMTNPLTVAFIPCGHRCCDECVEKMENPNVCHMCRKQINTKLELH